MIVNVAKTKFINFELKSSIFAREIIFHNLKCAQAHFCSCERIEKVSNFKYLGVFVDEKLDWKKHIDFLHNSLKRSIKTFYFLRNKCDSNLLRNIYFALIHSRLQYGIQCYGGSYKVFLDKLRKTQNQFLRVILFRKKRDSSFPLFKQLGVLPLQHLYVFKVLTVFFNRSGNIQSDFLCEQNYETRSKKHYIIKKPKTKKFIFQNSFVFIGPKLFNELPTYIKTIQNRNKFKLALKNWLFHLESISTILSVAR